VIYDYWDVNKDYWGIEILILLIITDPCDKRFHHVKYGNHLLNHVSYGSLLWSGYFKSDLDWIYKWFPCDKWLYQLGHYHYRNLINLISDFWGYQIVRHIIILDESYYVTPKKCKLRWKIVIRQVERGAMGYFSFSDRPDLFEHQRWTFPYLLSLISTRGLTVWFATPQHLQWLLWDRCEFVLCHILSCRWFIGAAKCQGIWRHSFDTAWWSKLGCPQIHWMIIHFNLIIVPIKIAICPL